MNEIQSFTPNDSRLLGQLEDIVRRGKQTFLEVGLALAEIREKKLYREQFKTFEDYCQGKWGWSRQNANNLIAGASAAKSLPKNLVTMVSNPKQAIALSKVPPPRRVQVLTAAKSAGPITAKTITAAANQSSPPPRPVPFKMFDATKHPVPVEVIPLWTSMTAESENLIEMISKVKGRLQRAKDLNEIGYRDLNHQDVIAKLDLAYQELKLTVKPYAVCAECQGIDRSTICGSCKGKGYVGKLFWEQCVPIEIKKAAGRDE